MEIVGGHFEKWPPFCIRDEFAMALFLKMFVRSYSITVPNFKFVSQSARFGQNFTPTTPTNAHCFNINVYSPDIPLRSSGYKYTLSIAINSICGLISSWGFQLISGVSRDP